MNGFPGYGRENRSKVARERLVAGPEAARRGRPGLGLVVETDGLRYHRTAAQQTKDRLRDQTHAAAGLTALRFSHAQVRYSPEHVERTLAAVAARLATERRRS